MKLGAVIIGATLVRCRPLSGCQAGRKRTVQISKIQCQSAIDRELPATLSSVEKVKHPGQLRLRTPHLRGGQAVVHGRGNAAQQAAAAHTAHHKISLGHLLRDLKTSRSGASPCSAHAMWCRRRAISSLRSAVCAMPCSSIVSAITAAP